MDLYEFKKIEAKWQKIWAKNKYALSEDFSNKTKHYHLVEFPYPSGAGLHVGHCMGYGASDAYCRMKRMQGFNVMYPMGWDAFGLPTENYAIANKVKPQDITEKSIAAFRKQMDSLGYSFDWSREVNTTDPNYYKWTQWIFLQFYKHSYKNGQLIEVDDDDKITPRMAYQAEMPINWCPSCKIGLAHEEVIAGRCERCDTEVTKKSQKQWLFRITAYAERLIEDLEKVDYEERIKTQQINWIGKSEGTNIKFPIADSKFSIDVYTTRADTLFGCTYVVLSPEHELVNILKNQIENVDEVEEYQEKARRKTDLERTELIREKTGVELKGIRAINPINNEKLPVWIADYCLASYGTGAVMAVPAHDERDYEFANKFNLPIKQSVAPYYTTTTGNDALRKDKKTDVRNCVLGLVKHWKENKFYLLDWEKFGWRSLIIGGVENGEENIEAVKREVVEETGYSDIKKVTPIGFTSVNHFFARHKDVNRYGYFNCFLIELGSDKFSTPEEDHIKNHVGRWIEADKVGEFLTLPNHKYFWDIFTHGEEAFVDYGVLINSDEFNDLSSVIAQKKITEKLKSKGAGELAVNLKLRDWIFSRQHYWGEPIPIVHCQKCGTVPVPEKDLPVKLPEVENYEPTNTGQSPLASITDWVNTRCPNCDGPAKRETDTMPNWAGSSWYYLRYCDSKNDKRIADDEKLKYWLPVDIYNGGMEHTTLHLLYSRFWHKFLYDLKAVPDPEPYQKRIAHGIILGPDRQKMSKSRGNIINPDKMIAQFGADTLRAYIMFIGPYNGDSAWSMNGISGVFRFLKRVWINFEKVNEKTDSEELLIKLNQTIAGVTIDIETFQMNTILPKLMELNNTIEKTGKISKDSYQKYLQLLFPACPHIAEELWEKSGFDGLIDDSTWPKVDEKYLVAPQITIAVQVNGKTRDIIEIQASASKEIIEETAKTKKIIANIAGRNIVKTIYVAGRIVNFVIE